MIVKEVVFEVICVWKLLIMLIVMVFFGNFFMILLKKWVGKMIELVFLMINVLLLLFVGMVVLIEILVLLLVKVIVLVLMLSLRLVKIGMVVFEEMVCWMLFNFLMKVDWLIVNFIS